MLKRKEILNEEETRSVSPLCLSKKMKKLTPTWNMKVFELDKKSSVLNDAQTLLGSIENQIVSLGKPLANLNYETTEFFPQNKSDNMKGFIREEAVEKKEIEKNKKFNEGSINKKNWLDIKIEETFKFVNGRIIRSYEKGKKTQDSLPKTNTEDFTEYLTVNLKDLYNRVNKKKEETKRLAETTSLLSLQTKQKLDFLENKVARIKMDLINPGYKTVQVLKETLVKPKRSVIFPRLNK